MSKLLSGFMQKMHLNDNEYPDDFDDTEELDDEPLEQIRSLKRAF